MIYYYKSTTSGRTKFVTFTKEWSNERMATNKNSINDLKSFDELKGCKVKLDKYEGIILGCQPIDEIIKGKYVGDNRYLGRKDVLNRNNLVQIFWTKGVLPTWQPFYKLELCGH